MSEEVDSVLLIYRFLCILEKYSIREEEVEIHSDKEWRTIIAAIDRYSERDKLYE